MRDLPTHPITFEEFLEWCDSETRAEWVNGKVVLMSPASGPHQRIGSFLEVILHLYVQRRRLGEIWRAPFLMKLSEIPSWREPDLLFVSEQRRFRVQETFLDGAADMVVEIISPESVDRDRREKMEEYARVGIREYWLIDPMSQEAEIYELGANGRYSAIPLDDDGLFRSRVIDGFFLRPEWLWQTPSLRTEDALWELGLQ